MKVVVVYSGSFINCPPAITVVNALYNLGYEVSIITGNPEDKSYFTNFPIKIRVPKEKLYEKPKSTIKWVSRYFSSRSFMRCSLQKEADSDTIVWLVSEKPIKYLGNLILKYKFVLQCLELGRNFYYSNHLPFKININRYLSSAKVITQCEENRAFIFQAWWKLDNKPYVLPNKMFTDFKVKRNSYIHDDTARNVIDKLKGKKIILYQGILNKDRPIENFIRAVDLMGDEYAFVIMSNYSNIYTHVRSKNYYFIPFVKPPYHLEITSHAYIGVLVYVPFENEYSPLNYIYCAPNKIWEYSRLSVPMIGNDIPGLKYPFEMNKCGICSNSMEPESIISAIKKIEESYNDYSLNARKFYEIIDIKERIRQIIENVKN